MAEAVLLILLSLVGGYAAARLRLFPEGAAQTLNLFVIWVCLPAVIIRLVPTLTFEVGLSALVLTPWAMLVLSVALVSTLSRAFAFSREVQGALLLCVPLGNTSFLGFPMIEALVGRDAVRYAALYDQLGSFLVLATYGTFVVARFSNGESPTIGAIVRRVVGFPPFIALLLALLPVEHPAVLDSVLERLGKALVPVAMFAVGLSLQLRLKSDVLPLVLGLTTKMVLAPLAAFALCRVLGGAGVPMRVAVLESAMPPMVTAGALATMAGLSPPLAAALVGYGVALSLVTLPALAALLF